MKGKRYREYLESDEWARRRAAALERAEHRCQLCNNPELLQVHHRTYERVGRERPEDLIVLCGGCHVRHHGRSPDGSRATRRQLIDQQILHLLETYGVLSYDRIRRQVRAPRSQLWSRMVKLMRTRRIEHAYSQTTFCLYGRRDVL